MKIAIASSELLPFAKTGGLADAVASLAKALAKKGNIVYTFLPRYGFINGDRSLLSLNDVKITEIEENENLHHLFIQHPIFNRKGIYGENGKDYPDNFERFTLFSKYVVDTVLKKLDVDILHINDWHTGFAPLYMKNKYGDNTIPVLFTIHNLAYQGVFPLSYAEKIGAPSEWFKDFLQEGMINFMKIGILTADAINTVSPTYAKEIQTKEFGEGLDKFLIQRRKDLYGILNGIDIDYWKPPYTTKTLGMKENFKKILKNKSGLSDGDIPLFGIVTRLAEQKGIDILLEGINRFLSMNVNFVLLGTGDLKYHSKFEKIAKKYPDKTSINLKFDAELAFDIYRGADFFLMPSRFEPCGLGQMISLINGTIPIVRKTGGLADTVFEYRKETGEGNGFLFEEYSTEPFLKAIKRAINIYSEKEHLRKLRINGMKSDFSFDKSASEYEKLYEKLLTQ